MIDIIIFQIPCILLLTSILILIGIRYVARFHRKHRKRRSPFPEKFLRSPGESLRTEIDQTYFDELSSAIFFFVPPLIFYSGHISVSYFIGRNESLLRIFISVIAALIMMTMLAISFIKTFRKRKNLELGYDGELAVGQELNKLMRYGYHVFHDLPCGNFNIDHVVVGASGVFAVETKARRKPILGDGAAEAKVMYDGTFLKFPTWTEDKPIKQASRQAKWLSDYLSKAVGRKVEARPVIALPGWFVEKTTSHGIPVVNPKIFHVLLKRKILSEEMIQRIAHQLEQKCRDVDPLEHFEKKNNSHKPDVDVYNN